MNRKPAPPPPKNTITITSITSPIRRGANATFRAETSPGANRDVTVIYKSGASTAGGPYPQAGRCAGQGQLDMDGGHSDHSRKLASGHHL